MKCLGATGVTREKRCPPILATWVWTVHGRARRARPGSTPSPLFDTLVFIGWIAIRSEPQQVRRSWIIYPVALWQRAPVWEAGGYDGGCKYEPLIPCEIQGASSRGAGYSLSNSARQSCSRFLLLLAAGPRVQPYILVVMSAHPDLQIAAGWGLLGAAITCAKFSRAGSPNGRREAFSTPPFGWLVLWLVVVACLVLACVSIADWGWLGQWRCLACHRCRGATRRSLKFSFCGVFHKGEKVVKMTRSEYVAILFNKDTFYTNIDVKSIYLLDTRRDLPDQVMEGEQGWVFQGVLSRSSFRRPPVSGQETFTVLSLHISHIYAKKRGIAKKLILTIRAIMISQQIDVVAGDFNGTAWRCSNRNRNISSTLDEAFADCAFPTPPGLTALWWPGSLPNNWADICGVLEPPGSDRCWKVRVYGAFSIPRKARGLRPNDQSCHHETWLHLDFVDWRNTRSQHGEHDCATSSRTAQEEDQWYYERPFALFVNVQPLARSCLLLHGSYVITKRSDELNCLWQTCHRRGMFWFHPRILVLHFLFALNIHLAQHSSQTPCHGVKKVAKMTLFRIITVLYTWVVDLEPTIATMTCAVFFGDS